MSKIDKVIIGFFGLLVIVVIFCLVSNLISDNQIKEKRLIVVTTSEGSILCETYTENPSFLIATGCWKVSPFGLSKTGDTYIRDWISLVRVK
jgi:hypothetical protein